MTEKSAFVLRSGTGGLQSIGFGGHALHANSKDAKRPRKNKLLQGRSSV